MRDRLCSRHDNNKLLTLIGITSLLIISCSTLPTTTTATSSTWTMSPSSPTNQTKITWEIQLNATNAFFQSIGMCKGTTDKTRKAGFIGGELGSIWRTLDGENWKQVAQFPDSAYWAGIYCFPDAQRVIAVGFSDGDPVLLNGAIITWSFDGGKTWTEQQPMPEASRTYLQSVHFYNDTHGIALPFIQGPTPLAYYTTNGGKAASDWNAVPTDHQWYQSHPIWVVGDVTKTFTEEYEICVSNDAGRTWPNCEATSVLVGSFSTLNDAVGTDFSDVYLTHNGGTQWNMISAVPGKVDVPRDMVWIPNSDAVILVGGNNWNGLGGAVVHSLDRGVTWTESMPGLPPTVFLSVDSVKISENTTEVWAVGWGDVSSVILHATVTTQQTSPNHF